MRMILSKQVYDQLDEESKQGLTPIPCLCIKDDALHSGPDPDCEDCEGGGVLYEDKLDPETAKAIEENLRSQGVPLGKKHLS